MTIVDKKHFLRLFYCCSVNLNAVSCLTEAVIHHLFRLQQENLTKTEYRKIDPNCSLKAKADSLPLTGTNFHCPKRVRATEVLLYINMACYGLIQN